jgi:LUC7 N_terminus
MATEEARAMLDALMGGDRNAPLPKGAALPGRLSDSAQLLLPGKRKKSCYDKDIDPLFTAWGIDCYELFVNTKSDLGANPNVVDQAAHEEFIQLPAHEQERLGYNYFLFQKLSELVRQCDRTVSRNKEKLKQELNRKLSQRGGQDFVQDVDEAAVEQLARAMVTLEDLTADLNAKLAELDEIVSKEEDRKAELEPLLESFRKPPIKLESDQLGKADAAEPPLTDVVSDSRTESETANSTSIKQEDEAMQTENGASDVPDDGGSASLNPPINEKDQAKLESLQMELGQLTLQRQRLVFDISRLITLIAPQQDAVESQRRHLNYVKSDISTDKTVCVVSGNFMSSRDADERIAAHYAGKQYVGWRLVRDKLESMIKKYGRYGPPPPGQADGPHSGGPSPPMGRGRGGFHGGPVSGRDFGREGGGYHGRGGSDRGSESRWERNGPTEYGRGGKYDDRRAPPTRAGWRR